jgi:hypothetical protein
VLALAKGLVWSVVLPPWYGPDEPSHYVYVQELVEDHWLARGYDSNAGKYYPPEIGCSWGNLGLGTISGPFHAEPPFDAPWLKCTSSQPGDRHATSPINAAGYTPVYYAAAVPFYLLAQPMSVETRVAAVRLWSVLLGVLAAAFAYLAARWALPESTFLSTAVAVLFTLQPMNSQQTAIVNNDALLIAVAAAFWWRFYRSLRHGLTLREALVLGGLVGLAYLVKPQGIFLAATLPVAYLVSRETQSIRKEMRRVAKLSAAAAVPIVTALMIGMLFSALAGNTSPLPSSDGIHGIQQYLSIYTDRHFEREYFLFISGFWGFFGWFQVALPNFVFVIITVVVGAGFIGALRLALKAHPLRPVLVASMLAVVVPVALIMVLELYAFRVSGALVLQGRSFLMLLVPLIVVLIRGWQQLLPPGPRPALAAAIVLAATLLNVVSLAVIIDAFYG